jgi:hypothetical protein
MVYEGLKDDVQEKEKAHRQEGASKTYSWPKEIGLEGQGEEITHT